MLTPHPPKIQTERKVSKEKMFDTRWIEVIINKLTKEQEEIHTYI